MTKLKQNPLRENSLERNICEEDVGFGKTNIKPLIPNSSLKKSLQNKSLQYSSIQNPNYHPFGEWTDYPYKFP